MHWPRKQSRGVQQRAADDMAGYPPCQISQNILEVIECRVEELSSVNPKHQLHETGSGLQTASEVG